MKGVENESYLPDEIDRRQEEEENNRQNAISLNDDPPLPVSEKLMDFDDVLPSVGEFGTYQIILFFLTAPFCFFLAFTYFSQMFITLVPDHWCSVPQLDNFNLTLEERKNLSIPLVEHKFLGAKPTFDKCKMYDVDYEQVLLDNLQPNSSWRTKSCSDGWNYDYTSTKYATIVSDYNWVCDDAGKPPLAQALFFAGAFIGGIISGYTADRFGRLPALILCNMFCAVAGVLTYFSHNFELFAFSRFVMGMGFDNCFTLMYILVLEYVGPSYRTLAGNLAIALFYTTGTTLLPWIAWGISDWRMFSLVLAIPTFFVVFAYWVVPESPRWLLSQGKYDKAFSILRRFARVNKKQVDESVYQKLKDSAEEARRLSANTPTPTVLDLLRTPRLRRNTILLTLLWVVIALVYDGHAKNTANLGLSVFLTSSIACSTELPADLVVVFFLDRWGRRALAFGSLLGASIFSLICVAIPVDQAPLAAALAIVGRFCVNITLNIGHQYGAELIPTSVRAQGISYVHMAGYIASLISPYIVDLARIDRILPLIVLGLLAFFGAVVGFLLPETMGATLPQTMEEGENFGRDQSLWDFPCCPSRRRRRQQETATTKTAETAAIKKPATPVPSVTSIVEMSQPTVIERNHRRID